MPLGAASAAIHTADLSKRYGDITALAGLSMTVPRGEVFGFLGPNGAGKTTAVKLLTGLAHATAGEAWVLGFPAGHLETRRRVGYLPELFRYQDWLSAEEVLAFHCQLIGITARKRANEIGAVLDMVGLSTRARDRVVGFSKGMQQRLGLACALLGSPDLVILDEPTSALDPLGRHHIREVIGALKQRGCTVFLNSHLLGEIEHVCDRVAIINKGAVVAEGTLPALLNVTHQVTVRLGGAAPNISAQASRFGAVQYDAGVLTVDGIDEEQIPDLVALLVSQGSRIYGVASTRVSLEDRFLELIERTDHAAPSNSAPHPA